MLRSGFLAWTRRAATLSTRLTTSSLSGTTPLTSRRLCADTSSPSVAAQKPEPVSVEHGVRSEASFARTDRIGQVGTSKQPVHVQQPSTDKLIIQQRTIFVSNFPDSMTVQELEQIFKEFDSGAKVEPIVRNPHSQPYAFIRLSSQDIVDDIIKKASLTKVEGVELLVARRLPKGPSTDHMSSDLSRSLYTTFTSGGRPASKLPTDEELSAFFHEVDPTAKVAVLNRRGYAFVEFSTRDLAIQARNELRDKKTGTGLGVKMKLRVGDNEVPRLDWQNVQDTSGRTVFVGNVPYVLDKKSVAAHFETVGTVSLVTMPLPMKTFYRDQNSLRNAGYCFVTFDTQEVAQEAIQKLNASVLGGQVIEVAPRKESNSQSESQTEVHTSTPNSEVYVCGLSLKLSTDEMKSFFEEVGQVVRVRGPIPSPTEYVSGEEQALHQTGYGFVTFTTEAAAAAAVSMLDGRNLADHVITVRLRFSPGSAEKSMEKRALGSNVESRPEGSNLESGHDVQNARQRKNSVHTNMPYDDLLGGQDQRDVHDKLSADWSPPGPDQGGLLSKISWSNKSDGSGDVQTQEHIHKKKKQPTEMDMAQQVFVGNVPFEATRDQVSCQAVERFPLNSNVRQGWTRFYIQGLLRYSGKKP